MTIQGDHAGCDGCGALVHVALEHFEHWEAIPWSNGPTTHMCPECQAKRERGILAEPFYLECVRCRRNAKDNPEITQWRVLPTREGERGARHVCIACFRPDDQLTV